jgi:regulator of cell morphogenesis and NO signaling
MYNPSQRLSDIIHHDHKLLPIFNRFGIKPGFGDKTLGEVCKAKHINSDFLIEILNTCHDPEYFPQQRFRDFPLPLIVDYLKKTHEYYYNFLIPEIENQLKLLIQSITDEKKPDILSKFYFKFKQELHEHLQFEDRYTFPYVIELQSIMLSGLKRKTFLTSPVKSIRDIEENHTDVESKLLDLKNIIIKYLNADYDVNRCNTLLTMLFDFEDDLHDHARIENKILIPRVLQIEKKLATA